jgi:hypothetical protein
LVIDTILVETRMKSNLSTVVIHSDNFSAARARNRNVSGMINRHQRGHNFHDSQSAKRL